MLFEIKSKYILQKIFSYINPIKYLKIIRHNKASQTHLNITLKDYETFYKEYNQIEIEIKPIGYIEKRRDFINCENENKSFFHIYFDDEKEERNQFFLEKQESEVSKIKIKIDIGLKSLEKLFDSIFILKEITFIKFNRKDFANMNIMFNMRINLTKINFEKCKTDNVKDMSFIFCSCLSLEQLNYQSGILLKLLICLICFIIVKI